MTIKFLLLINKQGVARLSKWFALFNHEEKTALESEIIRKCLARNPSQSSFFEHESFKIIYRRYVSLYVVVAVDENENELGILEMIHLFITSMDLYFDDVSELDILFSLDRVHMILDEMIVNGDIVETNVGNILGPIEAIDKRAQKDYGIGGEIAAQAETLTETITGRISQFFGMEESD